jgi:hypothetical protein
MAAAARDDRERGSKPDRHVPHPLRSLTTAVVTTTVGEDAITE